MTAVDHSKMRICWPDPDATCLQGGCLYCNDARPRSVASVRQWAATAGRVRDRCGDGGEDALKALEYGLARGRAGA
jgi:hypothetical protein